MAARDPRLVHALPVAPGFVGREQELQELRTLWQTGFRGVVALVGLGGAGKTALVARFLEDFASTATPRPDGMFVWSFYQEPDAGLFLQEAQHYFAHGISGTTPARGSGLLHLLQESLANGGPHLLVLDGLERVQDQEQTDSYGQVEDPLLKGLLLRLAEGNCPAMVLVTSRFPLTDLRGERGMGYRVLTVGGLASESAQALLRYHGVRGDDATLAQLVETYGAHALTIDHLGSLIGQIFDGDPTQAPVLAEQELPAGDKQAVRLARLLQAYEQHLPPEELTLLCQLCLVRRGLTADLLRRFFLCSPPVLMHTARAIAEQVRRLPEATKDIGEAELGELADDIGEFIATALCTSPLAGPEDSFREEVLHAVAQALDPAETERDFQELARCYAVADSQVPTDELPLGANDRESLHRLYAYFRRLMENPNLPYQGTKTDIPKDYLAHHLTGADLLHQLHNTRKMLRYLVSKHLALRRVRALCALYQRKWTLAGPLAQLDAAGLERVLKALVGRHLVLAEGQERYDVHPAVRDHFSRLASRQGAWHDLIRDQLISLVQRPGRGLPQDTATLDLIEEAIHHARAAGRTEEAIGLYQYGLGGLRHLGWKLGEMARGLRILRGFEPCPDRWGLAWFLRALGELESAYQWNGLPSFRADVRLLQGRLPEVAAEGEADRTAVAVFLMGQTTTVSATGLGCVVPRPQLWLYLGCLERVAQTVEMIRLFQEVGFEADRARMNLLQAEAHRRRGELTAGHAALEQATRWILHSGSVEHLCYLHLLQARFALDRRGFPAAQAAVTEGLRLARQSGLGLYHIEQLSEQAAIHLALGEPRIAEENARLALEMATDPKCQFQWGAASAGHLLGHSLAAQGQTQAARTQLKASIALRSRLGDPQWEESARLLDSLPVS